MLRLYDAAHAPVVHNLLVVANMLLVQRNHPQQGNCSATSLRWCSCTCSSWPFSAFTMLLNAPVVCDLSVHLRCFSSCAPVIRDLAIKAAPCHNKGVVSAPRIGICRFKVTTTAGRLHGATVQKLQGSVVKSMSLDHCPTHRHLPVWGHHDCRPPPWGYCTKTARKLTSMRL